MCGRSAGSSKLEARRISSAGLTFRAHCCRARGEPREHSFLFHIFKDLKRAPTMSKPPLSIFTLFSLLFSKLYFRYVIIRTVLVF